MDIVVCGIDFMRFALIVDENFNFIDFGCRFAVVLVDIEFCADVQIIRQFGCDGFAQGIPAITQIAAGSGILAVAFHL